MKLVIFGASSATGALLVDKALRAGHEVTAFVRDASKLDARPAGIKVISGNALNFQQVEEAIKGQDAVLSTLGPKGKPAIMAAESTRNIVRAMEKHGVKRLVLISVAGIPVPQDQRGFNLISALIKFLLRSVFLDRENQLAVLHASNVDWVAVRVPRLTDDPMTGSIKAFYGNPSPGEKVTRADVAEFMLKQVSEDQWLRQAPIVTNKI